MNPRYWLPCTWMRGGTSKGVFLLKADLPSSEEERDQWLLHIMGSPDLKQINGLGGGSSVTSKVAIIAPSTREDADVDYTFAQVSVDKALVSTKGNCGNISSAVGPFAIEKGLVPAEEPLTRVRIYNTNTDKIIEAEVQVQEGQVLYAGDYSIAGVPGTSAPIRLHFESPAGTMGRGLLPTGNIIDTLNVPDVGKIDISIIDAANPLAFIRAEDVGLKGTELPQEIDQDPELLHRLECIRGIAAVHLGLINDYKTSAITCPGIPKLTIVSAPQAYKTTAGEAIDAAAMDLTIRMMSMQKTHPTCAMTGAMCMAAASAVEGSLVQELLRPGTDLNKIRIAHPGGLLEAGVDFTKTQQTLHIHSTSGYRTAKLLLDGRTCITLK